MSDFNSALPVRTENPGDVKVIVVDATNPALGQQVNADGTTNVVATATDFDIRDLDSDQDNVKAKLADGNGDYYSATNPLTVAISKDNQGAEINDYATSAAVASAAVANHDYTVTALKTLILSQIVASASGKIKIEVQVESGVGTGTYNTKFVEFNSTAKPNIDLVLQAPIKVLAGVKVRVAITNKDLSAQDVYSTIVGQEV